MRFLIAVMCAALLSSCQTKQIDELNYSERKALAAQIAQRCADQGYGEGHPELSACLRQEVGKEYADRRNARIRQQELAQALSDAGESMQRSSAQNRTVTCTSNTFGTMTRTSCY